MKHIDVINKLNNIQFKLKAQHDFSWLKKYGTAFAAFDETGSGCIGIGMQDSKRKVFCKIAGANTVCAEVSPEKSVELLKNAVCIYEDLEHPNLTKLIEHYQYRQFYVAVFEWVNGECLFDHWNFDKYTNDSSLKSPRERFNALPAAKKLACADVLFSFLKLVAEKRYVAVDFYDGNLLYDFETETLTILDVDLFLKQPVINNVGEGWFGTKRLKALEEYIYGALIDEQTNVFTLGALLFDFFGSFTKEEIAQRYKEKRFIPCSFDKWQLSMEKYDVALKAVSPNRKARYSSIEEFRKKWEN